MLHYLMVLYEFRNMPPGPAFNHSPCFRERVFPQRQGRETRRRFPEVSKALQNCLDPV